MNCLLCSDLVKSRYVHALDLSTAQNKQIADITYTAAPTWPMDTMTKTWTDSKTHGNRILLALYSQSKNLDIPV